MKKLFYNILLGIILFFLAGCGKDEPYDGDVTPDRKSLEEAGHKYEFKNTDIDIEDTGFKAWIGTKYYTDIPDKTPVLYSIVILKRHENRWYEYFSRDYYVKDLPKGFLSKPATALFKYDRDSRTVTFIVGDDKVQYRLPVGGSTHPYIPTPPTPSSEPHKYDGGVIPDIGKRLHEDGRPSEWKCKHINLDKTGYKASVGAVIYTDRLNSNPDFYTIDIEKEGKDGSFVYFERDYAIKDLPDGFLDKSINEIVKYDKDSRTVTFIIGDKRIQYRLPAGNGVDVSRLPQSSPPVKTDDQTPTSSKDGK